MCHAGTDTGIRARSRIWGRFSFVKTSLPCPSPRLHGGLGSTWGKPAGLGARSRGDPAARLRDPDQLGPDRSRLRPRRASCLLPSARRARAGVARTDADTRGPSMNPADPGPGWSVGVAGRPPCPPWPCLTAGKRDWKVGGVRPGPARGYAGPLGRKKLLRGGGLSKFGGCFTLEIPQPYSAPYRKRQRGREGAPTTSHYHRRPCPGGLEL